MEGGGVLSKIDWVPEIFIYEVIHLGILFVSHLTDVCDNWDAICRVYSKRTRVAEGP